MHICTIYLDGNIAAKRQTMALAHGLVEAVGAEHTATIHPLVLPDANGLILTRAVTNIFGYADAIAQNAVPRPSVLIAARYDSVLPALALSQLIDVPLVQIQNPNPRGTYAFDVAGFQLIVRQPFESFDGPNVIDSGFTLHALTPKILKGWRQDSLRICRHYRCLPQDKPMIGVMIGGGDEYIHWSAADFVDLGSQLRDTALANPHCHFAILTSRRTGSDGVNMIADCLDDCANVTVDYPAGVKDVFSRAIRMIVTFDSFTAVNESLAAAIVTDIVAPQPHQTRHPFVPVVTQMVKVGQLGWWQPGTDLGTPVARVALNPDREKLFIQAVCNHLKLPVLG